MLLALCFSDSLLRKYIMMCLSVCAFTHNPPHLGKTNKNSLIKRRMDVNEVTTSKKFGRQCFMPIFPGMFKFQKVCLSSTPACQCLERERKYFFLAQTFYPAQKMSLIFFIGKNLEINSAFPVISSIWQSFPVNFLKTRILFLQPEQSFFT